MHLITFLTTLTALAATANAGCYSEEGEDAAWWEPGYARSMAKKACATGGKFAGEYGKAGTSSAHRTLCVNALEPPANYGDRRQKYIFEVTHVGGDDKRTISESECYDGLMKEINGCAYGGVSSYKNWRYKSDPNAGSC